MQIVDIKVKTWYNVTEEAKPIKVMKITTYPTSDTVATTGIVLNEALFLSDKIMFLSHYWETVSSASLYILSSDDFSRLNIALFIGCYTGAGGEDAYNLPSTIVQRGAKAAIGFSGSIDCAAANTWTLNFFEQMLQGATLQEAVEHACEIAEDNSGLKSVVTCGDMSIRIS